MKKVAMRGNMKNASRILVGITNGKKNSKDLVMDEWSILKKIA
jgi:hypothetical protein